MQEVVQNAWKIQIQGSNMFKLQSKVKYSRKYLLEWRKVENTNARKKINDIKGQIDRLKEKGGEREWSRWGELKVQLEEAYKEEEKYWSKKSKVNWLQKGHRNTKYFHAVTTQKRVRNKIEKLINRVRSAWVIMH